MALVVAPRFSKRFRRLCQTAAVAGTDRSEQVMDGLLPVAMVYGDGPWREPDDWVNVIQDVFGLVVSEADILAAINRAVENGRLAYQTFSSQYVLRAETKKETIDRIEAGENLERRAQASWLAEVESLVPDLNSDELWSCLLGYARRAFLSHGLDAMKLLDASVEDFADLATDETPETLLKAAMAEDKLPESTFVEISNAIAVFFNGKDADRVAYVAELVNSTYNFLSLSLDPETRRNLLANLPSLIIFVDTNIVYGMLGTHVNPLSAAATDLFRVLTENDFPFKVYYHEKTLRELDFTLSAIGDRLRRERCSPAVSRALLNLPRSMSSIERRYHQLNSEIPTSVDVFLSRYSNLPLLLAEQGLTIFREPELSSEESRRRAELVPEYQAFLAENNKREKAYTVLDHDISIWCAAASRQIPRQKGPLSSGALVISADHMFRRFDREILAPFHGTGTWIVTRPDTLLQALHPFLASVQQSDAVFAQVFATPEFRGIGRDSGDIISRVASVLATYEDMTEETATKILSNSMLLSRLKHFDQNSDTFQRIIQDELVRENEALQQERDEALARARQVSTDASQVRELVKGEVSAILDQLRSEGNWDAVAKIEKLEKNISDIDKSPRVHIERVTMGDANEYSGGYFQNTASQIGAQGPNAKARDFTQQTGQNQEPIDLVALASQLETLKVALLQEASDATNYQAVAEVQAAKEAASSGDEPTVWRHLANAGRWTLDVAMRIGTELAAAAISHALGVGA